MAFAINVALSIALFAWTGSLWLLLVCLALDSMHLCFWLQQEHQRP